MTGDQSILSDWECEVIQSFASLGESFGIQRSVATVYGLLFCSEKPLSMDDVIEKLGISKGSASQSLKSLTVMGAARKHPQIGDRKMFYVPERSLRRLAQRFLDTHVMPGLQNADDRLGQLADLVPEGADGKHARACLSTLNSWHSKSKKLIPTISLFLK